MSRRTPVVLFVLLIFSLGLAAMPFSSPVWGASTPTRIMPLGDSITDGYNVAGGYRIELWQKFITGNHQIDFVGSMKNGPTNLGDKDHEGHSGWRIDQIDANINSWLTTYEPQLVLLLIGTNDMLQNTNLAGAPSRLGALIDKIAVKAPTAHIIVASLPPLTNSTNNNRVLAYNAAIPGIVDTRAAAGKLVSYVDMYSALTTADLADGVHPNLSGYNKMAGVWYSALVDLLGTPTAPTATPTGTGTTPPSPPLALSLTESFDQLTPGPIDGQSSWRAVGAGAWSVTGGNGGQIVTQTQGGGSSFHLNQIAYAAATYGDQRVAVDFQYTSGGITPQVWARKTAATGDGGGYFVYHWPSSNRQWVLARHRAGSGASLEQLAAVQGSQVPAFAEGAWYTVELSVVDNSAAEPVLEVYVYATGEARPASPLLRYTDTSKAFSTGYAALGNEGTAAYDNFKLYAPTTTEPPAATPTSSPTATASPSPAPASPTPLTPTATASATASATATAAAGSASFYRAINLNGEALSIDGQAWEGKTAPGYSVSGSLFCNQGVSLSPATDSARATMLRCSVWGRSTQVSLGSVAAGSYQVYLYVWEDNSPETFSIKLQGQTVQSGYNSGPGGTWRRLGPWPVTLATAGPITLATTGGAANLSGIEVWRGEGGSSPATATATATTTATATATGTAAPGSPSPTPVTPTATASATATAAAGSASFYRAINLNGADLTIDGQAWEGKSAPGYSATGSAFCNQSVTLNPQTDSARATMLRCSIWSWTPQVSLSSVPAGSYQVYLYVWEDNSPETFSIKLQGQTVQSGYNSGPGGTWRRLGPWPVTLATAGPITLATTGGAANLSGIEVWRGQ